MDSYLFLVQLSAILLCTKLLGILTKRVSLPQVVGALIAGLLLGPACFGLIPDTAFLDEVAELGVITLMFTAGMETDLDGLKRAGKSRLYHCPHRRSPPLVMGLPRPHSLIAVSSFRICSSAWS
jgi:Kef-type K+ transport system membrane component KefB